MQHNLTSVVLLNWNEMNVSAESVDILMSEPNVEVILVDNGSELDNHDREYFQAYKDGGPENDRFHFIALNENMGSSIARNIGIQACKGNRIFLMDGDILYVKGTIALYNSIFNECIRDYNLNVGCVGYCDVERSFKTGINGTKDRDERHVLATTPYQVEQWFPMAWTQYGLFDAHMLKMLRFVDVEPFNGPGHGYEDDWLFHAMEEAGYKSISVNTPLYFHDANKGLRNLKDLKQPDLGIERQRVFFDRWKSYGFVNKLRDGIQRIVLYEKYD